MNTVNTIEKNTGAPTKTLIERLFSVGAHFGFTRSRRHPTATQFIFANKQGTDIIDLEKTAASIEDAKSMVHEAGKAGKTILFVGSKEEIKTVVEAQAKFIEMPFVVNRWVGGMLTNFGEIKKRINRLTDLTAQGESGELERKYTKKERVLIGREHAKLSHNFAGIQKMERLPSIMIVVDPRHEAIAVAEANQLNIPVIGIANSDTNLKTVGLPVVVNDGLQASVSLVLAELAQAYTAGKAEFVAPRRDDTRRRDR